MAVEYGDDQELIATYEGLKLKLRSADSVESLFQAVKDAAPDSLELPGEDGVYSREAADQNPAEALDVWARTPIDTKMGAEADLAKSMTDAQLIILEKLKALKSS